MFILQYIAIQKGSGYNENYEYSFNKDNPQG